MVDLVTLGVGFVVNVIVGTIVLHIATLITKVEEATIMKALMAAVIAAILTLIFAAINPLLALLGPIITIIVIKYVYDTGWGKAIYTWIIYFVLTIIIGFILAALGLAVLFAAT